LPCFLQNVFHTHTHTKKKTKENSIQEQAINYHACRLVVVVHSVCLLLTAVGRFDTRLVGCYEYIVCPETKTGSTKEKHSGYTNIDAIFGTRSPCYRYLYVFPRCHCQMHHLFFFLSVVILTAMLCSVFLEWIPSCRTTHSLFEKRQGWPCLLIHQHKQLLSRSRQQQLQLCCPLLKREQAILSLVLVRNGRERGRNEWPMRKPTFGLLIWAHFQKSWLARNEMFFLFPRKNLHGLGK
jgi:hypothetical protein